MNSQMTRYMENQVSSTSPEETILLLYDGALKFLRSAIKEIEIQNKSEKSRLIEKTIKIIDHLQSCLNQDNGGLIAENLNKLYDYMQIKLTEANLRSDVYRIEEVIKLLTEIRDGWSNMCNQSKSAEKVHDDALQLNYQDNAGSDPAEEPDSLQDRKIAIKV